MPNSAPKLFFALDALAVGVFPGATRGRFGGARARARHDSGVSDLFALTVVLDLFFAVVFLAVM